MKSLVTLLLSAHLLLAGLMPHADVHELSKLPNLVTHFLEHKTDANASLVEFLAVHYGSPEDGLQEHQDKSHEELPFQDHQHAWYSHAFIAAPATEWTLDKMPFLPKQFGTYTSFYFSQNQRTIFQPPKV